MATWLKPVLAGVATTASLIGGAGLAAHVGGLDVGLGQPPAGDTVVASTLALPPAPELKRGTHRAGDAQGAAAPALTGGGLGFAGGVAGFGTAQAPAAGARRNGVEGETARGGSGGGGVAGGARMGGVVAVPGAVGAASGAIDASRMVLRVASATADPVTSTVRLTVEVRGQQAGGDGAATPARLQVDVALDPATIAAARAGSTCPVALSARLHLDSSATSAAPSDLRVQLQVVSCDGGSSTPVVTGNDDDGSGLSNAVQVVVPLPDDPAIPPRGGSPAAGRGPAGEPVEVRVPVAPAGDVAPPMPVTVPVDAPAPAPGSPAPAVQVAVTVTPGDTPPPPATVPAPPTPPTAPAPPAPAPDPAASTPAPAAPATPPTQAAEPRAVDPATVPPPAPAPSTPAPAPPAEPAPSPSPVAPTPAATPSPAAASSTASAAAPAASPEPADSPEPPDPPEHADDAPATPAPAPTTPPAPSEEPQAPAPPPPPPAPNEQPPAPATPPPPPPTEPAPAATTPPPAPPATPTAPPQPEPAPADTAAAPPAQPAS